MKAIFILLVNLQICLVWNLENCISDARAFYYDNEEMYDNNTEEYDATIWNRIKRGPPPKCAITDLSMTMCGASMFRTGSGRLEASYAVGCTVKQLSFVFYYGIDGRYNYKVNVAKPNIKLVALPEIKKLSIGTHYVYVHMKCLTLKNVKLKRSSGRCTFFIRAENATAKIGDRPGIYVRTVQSKKPFTVTGSHSMNNDMGKELEGLQFKWSCTDTKGYCAGRDLGQGSSITIPAEYAINQDTFNFTLSVKTVVTLWQEEWQQVNVNDSNPVSIYCVNNCYKLGVNPQKGAHFMGYCEFNCDKINPKQFKWLLHDKALNKVVGGCVKAGCGAKTMKPGRYYWSLMDSKDGRHFSQYDFTVFGLPKLENCKVSPPTGTPFTEFKVDCAYEGDGLRFEISASINDNIVISKTVYNLEEATFQAPASVNLSVKIVDVMDIYKEQKVYVKVDPVISDIKNTDEIKDSVGDTYYGTGNDTSNSVEALLAKGDYGAALHKINVVAQEMGRASSNQSNMKEYQDKMKQQMLSDLAKIPIDSIEKGRTVNGIVNQLAVQKTAAYDSDMANKLGRICKDISTQQLQVVEHDIHGDIATSDIVGSAKDLMNCAEIENMPVMDMFENEILEIDIPFEVPIIHNLSDPSFEDYPEYQIDDILDEKKNEFLEAGNNFVEICKLNGEAIANTLVADPLATPVSAKTANCEIFVARSLGFDLCEVPQGTPTVGVLLSQDLKLMNNTLSLTICISKANPFWALSNTMVIPSEVVIIRLQDSDEEKDINYFSDPVTLNFTLNSSLIETKNTSGTAFFVDEEDPFFENYLTIHQIEVKQGESFVVEFHDLKANDSFEVVITNFRRPTLKDFEKATRINKVNNRIAVSYREAHDTWHFLAILPSPRMMRSAEDNFDYTLSVLTPKCVIWNARVRNWAYGCPVQDYEKSENITCRCSVIGVMAGVVYYNHLKLVAPMIPLEIEIVSETCYIIMVTTCIIIFAYCILLIYSVQKNETVEDCVYFLSDVPYKNRFGYLIVVRTGRKFGAGTTSNISIRIYGEKCSSQQHVLNFPDPHMELLQKGQEDYFVLATPRHLGRITKVELWFDCIGANATWFCDKLKVCDLQTKDWYAFDVKKWFRLDGKVPRILYAIFPTAKAKRDYTKRQRIVLAMYSFGGFNHTIWRLDTTGYIVYMSKNDGTISKFNDDPVGTHSTLVVLNEDNSIRGYESHSFTFVKRLTVLLSIVLTLCTLTMFCYGLPELVPRDSIQKRFHYGYYNEIVYYSLFSSIVTFGMHSSLKWLFEHSQVQCDPLGEKRLNRFPFSMTLLCWSIVFFLIILDIHCLLFYGLLVMEVTSWLWLTTVALGLFFYIFILDHTFNIILIMFGYVAEQISLNYGKIIKNVEMQRTYVYQHIGGYIYRAILTPLYTRMDKHEFLVKRAKERARRDVVWQIEDLFMFLLYMFILYMIILSTKDDTLDLVGHHHVLALMKGEVARKPLLAKVNELDDFVKYVETTVIPSLQSHKWYGTYAGDIPGMTIDYANKYLGVPRLRQQRVEDQSCYVAEVMEFLNRSCRSSSYFFQHDFINYTPGWREQIPEFYKSRQGYIWGFTPKSGSAAFIGDLAFYGRGGYVADLGRSIRNSLVNFNYLRRHNWIDGLTRGIFIEVPLYNVNTNAFNFVSLIIEKSASGYLRKQCVVQTARLFHTNPKFGNIVIFITCLFILLVIALCIRTGLRIYRTKTWYYRDLWHIVDFCIIAVSLAWIGIYGHRMASLKDFLNQLEERRHNDYLEYYVLVDAESSLTILASFLICFSTVRLWKVLRFAVIFRTVERTLYYSIPGLCAVSFYCLTIATGFAFTGNMLFGSHSDNFMSIKSTFQMLALIAISVQNEFDRDALGKVQSGLEIGYTYYIMYLVFALYATTLYAVLFILNFAKAQEFCFEEILEYNVKDFVKEKTALTKLIISVAMKKFRLKAGSDERKLIWPKPNDQRYSGGVQVDSIKMMAMSYIARCIFRKTERKGVMYDSDYVNMLHVINNLFSEKTGEMQIFFTNCNKSRKFRLIDDLKMLQIETVVTGMLETPDERRDRLRTTELIMIMKVKNNKVAHRINNRLTRILEALNRVTFPPHPK